MRLCLCGCGVFFGLAWLVFLQFLDLTFDSFAFPSPSHRSIFYFLGAAAGANFHGKFIERYFGYDDLMDAMANRRVLALNRGSSSLKASLYEAGEAERRVLSMSVSRVGETAGRMVVKDGSATTDEKLEWYEQAMQAISACLKRKQLLGGLAAVGHRLVHGGTKFSAPQRITPEIVTELEKLKELDPDHMPEAIASIQFVAQEFLAIPQVACFDTSFHRTMPKVAEMYALPRQFYDQGIRRYGFHGLSYEYVLSELRKLDAERANGRVIIAHLGNGASVCALREGKSIDTSMGFTPLEGLVMGTRSGDIDAGAVTYLVDGAKQGAPHTSREVNRLLNRSSGLLGVSGQTGDMRELLQRESTDSRAAEAIALFCYRATKYIGAYAAALGGLDILVFTGGIGEQAPAIRERCCAPLGFLGVEIDSTANSRNASQISTARSQVRVRVIETNEELMIVRHVASLLGWNKSPE
jgi:acetate kinase